MPALTLIVCLHQQRDLLERLLRESAGCYDDLVVVHDGPDESGIRQVVETAGGRFFERPRAFQQEPHLPFAFGEARHDWILHLDADEFPSAELKLWLKNFRQSPEPASDISGYTCIWPIWDGRRALSKKLWAGRIFLFSREHVRFFGMAEQPIVPDGGMAFRPLDFILHHQPKRKSYGLHNVLMRKQAYRWRDIIARSLLGRPTDLACWRWENPAWPPEWEAIRRRPLQTGVRRLTLGFFRSVRLHWRTDRKLFLNAAINGPVNHALICLKFWQLRRTARKPPA